MNFAFSRCSLASSSATGTLAIADGADPDVIETRTTHTRKARNMFDGYNRGLHWERACGEILKLRITRGPQTSAIEQPLPASGGHEPLPFAAVAASSVHLEESLFNPTENYIR